MPKLDHYLVRIILRCGLLDYSATTATIKVIFLRAFRVTILCLRIPGVDVYLMHNENCAINVVHIASGDLWAGAEVQLYQLAKELQKNARIRLSIILLNHGILEEKLLAAGIAVIVIDEKKINNLLILAQLYSYLKTLSPDIVHTHRRKENILGGLAAMFVSRTRSLRTVHGAPETHAAFTHIHSHLLRYMDWFVGNFLQDRIVAVSAQLAKQLATQFSEDNVRIVENGIDINELQAAGVEPVSLPGPSNSINIALIGRLVPVKRIDIFIHIARVLKEKNDKRYIFYIFGDGPLHADIMALIGQLNLNEQIFMLGFRKNICAYLAKMNFLLITSEHEGLPMNLLEALGLKIPVIAHAVGGIPSVLGHGKYGILIDSDDPRIYAHAIEQALTDVTHLSSLVQNGYQHLTQRYAINHTASLYFQLYLEMLT